MKYNVEFSDQPYIFYYLEVYILKTTAINKISESP